ncbi:unnamed protein product [Lepeophtheirus salmonis]|nr:unnamed protein product [Lepeophtheirus salmonis]CAF2833645.1 unnamed protein product [Lepeophtheirus salmonis]
MSEKEDTLPYLSVRKQLGIKDKDRSLKASVKRIFESKKKNLQCTKKLIFKHLPIIEWMKNYNFKGDFFPEIMVMAYALLAGLGSNPVVGLYTAIFPVFIYLFLLSITTRFLRHKSTYLNTRLQCISKYPTYRHCNRLKCSKRYNTVRNWKYSWLLSEVLVSGYTTAAAFHVLSSQLKGLFGLEDYMSRSHDSIPKLLFICIDFFKNIANINIAALVVSFVAVTLQVVNNEYIKPRVSKFCKFPIPIQAIVVVIGAGVSFGVDLYGNYGVSIIQDIPSGLPAPSFPRLVVMKRIIFDSLVVAIVGFSITLSMGKIFATKYNYAIDGGQEILAECLANLFGTFFSSLPVGASMSRSMVQVGAGCKSQLTTVFSITFLLLFIFFAGPFFKYLPKAILASIIVVALKGMFLQIHDFKKFYKKSKVDGIIWISTFIFTIILDIDYGLYASIGVSLLILINRHSEPRIVELGMKKIKDSEKRYEEELWVELNASSETCRKEGLIVFRVIGVVDFTNYEIAIKALKKLREEVNCKRHEDEEEHFFFVLDLSCSPQIDQTAVKYLKIWLDTAPHYPFLVATPGSQPDRMLLRCGVKESTLFSTIGEADRRISLQKLIISREKSLPNYINQGYNEDDPEKGKNVL